MQATFKLTQGWHDGRRVRAWELWQAGWKQYKIAEALGVSQGAVSQWINRARKEGGQVLERRSRPGPKPRLTRKHRAELIQLLMRGAKAYGFAEDFWTSRRVAEVIRRQYGISYHPDHVRRILKASGIVLKRPKRRATRANQEVIKSLSKGA